MIKNVGSADKLVRFVLGTLLILLPYVTALAIWDNPVLRWGAPIIGLVLVVTAIVSHCPVYRVMGLGTYKA